MGKEEDWRSTAGEVLLARRDGRRVLVRRYDPGREPLSLYNRMSIPLEGDARRLTLSGYAFYLYFGPDRRSEGGLGFLLGIDDVEADFVAPAGVEIVHNHRRFSAFLARVPSNGDEIGGHGARVRYVGPRSPVELYRDHRRFGFFPARRRRIRCRIRSLERSRAGWRVWNNDGDRYGRRGHVEHFESQLIRIRLALLADSTARPRCAVAA